MIRELNSSRNALAPISSLPPELLGRIFIFVIEKDPDTEYSFSFDFTSWLNFSYVSQGWRKVALNTPDIWNTPPFLYPTWARHMLERSKMAHLVVRSDTSLLVNPTFMKEVFDNHGSRIQEIDLRGLTSSFLSSILENIQPSSLRLRSLNLSCTHYSLGDDNTDVPVFPAHLLAQPDSLQRLEIDRCAFDCYMQPHPFLTHLTVQKPPFRPLLSEFVTALSGMPALETLEMMDSLPLATKAIKLGKKVELPKLSSLHLYSMDNFFEVLNILEVLVVPCTTRVELSYVKTVSLEPQDTAIPLSNIGPPLNRFFSCMTGNLEKQSYNALRLYFAGEGPGLSAWRKIQPDMTANLPDLSLNFPIYQPDQFLDEILPCLPLFDLQTLFIDITLGQNTILRHFGRSTTLQTVELQALELTVVSDFLKALTHKPEGYERLESAYDSVSFPALQSLNFNRTTFDNLNLDEMLDCLMERYERGAEVQKLDIRNCRELGDDDIRLLREIVADVKWDEIVQSELVDWDDSCDSDLMGYYDDY